MSAAVKGDFGATEYAGRAPRDRKQAGGVLHGSAPGGRSEWRPGRLSRPRRGAGDGGRGTGWRRPGERRYAGRKPYPTKRRPAWAGEYGRDGGRPRPGRLYAQVMSARSATARKAEAFPLAPRPAEGQSDGRDGYPAFAALVVGLTSWTAILPAPRGGADGCPTWRRGARRARLRWTCFRRPA